MCTRWRPVSSRVIREIAPRLTSVERWICQNCWPSSRGSNSRIGVRMKASSSLVCTRVYFSSDRKNSTSFTSTRRVVEPTEHWIQRNGSGACETAARSIPWPIFSSFANKASTAGSSATLPFLACSRARTRLAVCARRCGSTGLSR